MFRLVEVSDCLVLNPILNMSHDSSLFEDVFKVFGFDLIVILRDDIEDLNVLRVFHGKLLGVYGTPIGSNLREWISKIIYKSNTDINNLALGDGDIYLII